MAVTVQILTDFKNSITGRLIKNYYKHCSKIPLYTITDIQSVTEGVRWQVKVGLHKQTIL